MLNFSVITFPLFIFRPDWNLHRCVCLIVQDTKKCDCPAKIHLRKIIKYPENKVSLFKLLNKGSGGTTINMNDH